MAKKKKKSRDGDDGEVDSCSRTVETTPPRSEKQQQHLISQDGGSSSIPAVDVISLRLVKGSSSSSSSGGNKRSSLRYSPAVALYETDANTLDVITGDQVFVMSTIVTTPATSMNDNVNNGNMKVSRVAIVRVDVVDGSSDRSMASPNQLSPYSTRAKSSQLNRGSCYVLPSSLADSLMEDDGKDDSFTTPITLMSSNLTATAETSTPIQSIPSPSSSSSSTKARFSFARGGGGDLMISPSSKTPTTPSTPSSATKQQSKSSSTVQVWIVPVDSNLGDKLGKYLVRTAKTLTIRDQQDTSSSEVPTDQGSTFWKGGPLCQRLVTAHILGEYLSVGSNFTISFQGRKTKCQVDNIVGGLNEDEETLARDLEGLSITSTSSADTTTPSLIPSPESTLLQSLHAIPEPDRRRILLYKVTRETQIHFPCDTNIKNQTNEVVEATIDNTTPSLPKQFVAGLDVTLEQLQSALETPLSHPELFQSHLRPPKGVLLHGPSGVGKSSMALQVGQTLEGKGYHVLRVYCATLQSRTAFVGEAERRLVQIFDSARKPRPSKVGCLLILDDIHLICPRRQGTDLGADRLASTLLALLDGLEDDTHSASTRDVAQKSYYPTVVLAITTNPGMLDAALRRPGRLDSEIEVPLPDEPSIRQKILKFHLQSLGSKTAFSDAEWLELARLAKGFTGADLKLAAKEALRNSSLETQGSPNSHSFVEINVLRKAIRSTKPSAIKAVTVEIPRVPWSSIGGMDEVKRQLREAIELPLTHSATFQRFGIRPPRGVLLYGPPGCSKTLMARALATEGHMNFLAVKGPELLSKWLGESERALAALFRRARLASPAIIFFDEVDAIASKRGGSSSGGERLLSQLLTELDGIQSKDDSGKARRVVIVCATNRPDLLDSALMRPGRIDRMIYVGVPDHSSREGILKIGLEGKPCADDVDISRLVDSEVSGGLSGAELIAACRDAALLAMEEYEEMEGKSNAPIIRMNHLLQSLKGMERQITPSMLDFYASFQGKSSLQ